MCGIIAICYECPPALSPNVDLNEALLASVHSLLHRGPDGNGTWTSEDGRVGLGHARLSIIDPLRGAQPLAMGRSMQSGIDAFLDTLHCVVNGEIYDYTRIRAECEACGIAFRTDSDSELVLALYSIYGIALLPHIRGEFAFVLYDEDRQLCFAARDRFGIKPLYYTFHDEVQVDADGKASNQRRLLVASEIKAFLGMGWKPEWNLESIIHQGEYGDDRTVFKGVYKVPPGYYVTYDSAGHFRRAQYWDHEFVEENQITVPLTNGLHPIKALTNGDGKGGINGTSETLAASIVHDDPARSCPLVQQAVTTVRSHLVSSVRLRMRSDVPIAVNLSGGIDSAAVAGIVAEALKEEGDKEGREAHKLDVFTLAFPDRPDVDEAPVALRMAESIGARMHFVTPSEQDLVDEFDNSVWHSEAPLMYLHGAGKIVLSRAVSQAGFKVVLSGEGADEIFGGYNYLMPDFLRQADTLTSTLYPSLLPLPTFSERMSILKAITSRPREQDHVTLSDMSLTDCQMSRQMLGDLLTHRIIGTTSPPADWYEEAMVRKWGTPDIAKSIAEAMPERVRRRVRDGRWHSLHGGLYVVQKTALGNLILNHLGDRPEMANGVEGRPPFLDHKLVEYVNSLPVSLKIRPMLNEAGSESTPRSWKFSEKWLLREAVRPYVTPEIFMIKKSMYNPPIPLPKETSWLSPTARTPLQEHLQKRLTKENVERLGFISWRAVEAELRTFLEKPDSPKDGGLDRRARRLLWALSFVVMQERFKVPKAII